MAVTTFDNPKESLPELLKSIAQGKTQLPDFQRGWVWDDEHIRSLLASVSMSYPIGVVMMLQGGNPDVRFKPRLVEGVGLSSPGEPERLILDGQQRLTSLFQSLLSGAVVKTRDSKGKPVERWYYIDMEKALDPTVDREDAIVAVPGPRKVINFRGDVEADYSTPPLEQRAMRFPLSKVFDSADWRTGFFEAWDYDKDKIKFWNRFEQEILEAFKQYQVPIIALRKETPKEAVCQVFEKVNTGGVSLNVFELLTATFAADDFNLREDWDARQKKWRPHKALAGLQNTDFLQAITLLASYQRRSSTPGAAVTAKRKDVLKLTEKEYKTWADAATDAFIEAAKLLHSQKIFEARDLPYRTQLVPLSAILALLGEEAETAGAKEKILRWYWNGVLGELYGGAVETRFSKDVPEVVEWVRNGGQEPTTVQDASFLSSRLLTLRTRNSAAYKGIAALVMRAGAHDFRKGDPLDHQLYFTEAVDIHHIFPRKFLTTLDVEKGRQDCIVNKTPIAAKTNRMIGGVAPSRYLSRMQQKAQLDPAKLDGFVASHLIDPTTLRNDDFHAFFESRSEALLGAIERAMGKAAQRTEVEDETGEVDDSVEEGDI